MPKALKSLKKKYSAHKTAIIGIGSFFLGSILSPLLADLIAIGVKSIFHEDYQKSTLISKIKLTINHTHKSASRANYLTTKLAKLVCEKIYHKKYENLPCYYLSPNKRIIALVGQSYIDNMNHNIHVYELNVKKLADILLKNENQYPDLKKLNIMFQKWLVKVENNCRFPTNAYYAWEELFTYGINKNKRIYKKPLLYRINKAVDLGKGGYPSNCKNYPKT